MDYGDFMAYFDYSATTPVNKEVLDSFYDCTLKYIGNPNSLHKLGVDSKHIIDLATKQIKDLLHIDHEIIYTSGSSEANNLALKGICFKYQNRGKHIITTKLEHSSISSQIEYLTSLGFEVSYVKINNDGKIDLDDLKRLLTKETILVSINAVNSELGILQPVEEIGKIIKDYPKCYFHVDMTQAIGKVNIKLDDVDLFSFAAHKFYGIKGIGVLAKRKNIVIDSIIHGGASTTVYRSGTPATSLIVSLAKALRLALLDLDKKYDYVNKLNNIIRKKIESYELIKVNSPNDSIPHILNISMLNVKPEVLLHALESFDVYVSTKSACSSDNSYSEAVYLVTGDMSRASSSIRISLSYLTTEEEVEILLAAIDKCYKELTCLR